MHDRLAHLMDERFLDPFGPVRANDSCNSAHAVYVLRANPAISGAAFEMGGLPSL